MVTSETPNKATSVSGPRSALNATGVVCHRDVGAAPLPVVAIEQMAKLAGTFAGCLEPVDDALEKRVAQVTGAEEGLVVNTHAGATLLALSVKGAGARVIVSRAELLESDDGVRVAELVERSGGQLVEVGAANCTRLEDYERALTQENSVILKVQARRAPSAGLGEVGVSALVELARRAKASVVYDQHDGALTDVRQAIVDGVALATFCGEALLGGPQAGVLVGRSDVVASARGHWLTKTLRLDALRLAAIGQVLELLASGRLSEVPALRMRAESLETIGGRASLIAACIGDEAVVSRLGENASVGVVVPVKDPSGIATYLRNGEPSLLVRATNDAVILDARTLFDRDVMPAATAVRQALAFEARQAGTTLALVSTGEKTEAAERGKGSG